MIDHHTLQINFIAFYLDTGRPLHTFYLLLSQNLIGFVIMR